MESLKQKQVKPKWNGGNRVGQRFYRSKEVKHYEKAANNHTDCLPPSKLTLSNIIRLKQRSIVSRQLLTLIFNNPQIDSS